MSEIRVMIIDDEKMITKMLKGYLEDHGFAVKTAHTGEEDSRFSPASLLTRRLSTFGCRIWRETKSSQGR